MPTTKPPKRVHDDDIKRSILDELVLRPRLKAAARKADIHPTTLFRWIKESVADPQKHSLQWLGHDAPFFQHVNAARKLNVVALDHAARDLAINGHTEPRFHDGKPVYRRDPKLVALSLNPDLWELTFGQGGRPITDTFERDENGALIQETVTHPPNPQVLVKLLTSLAPSIYGEKSEVNVNHGGHVWIEGGTQQTPALMPPPDDANQLFGLTQRPDEVVRPTNVLVAPRPCVDSDEFDKRWRRKLLREVVLFRDAEGKLLGPLPDDVIVAGSIQHRAFQDAGIAVTAVRAETLLDEGFESDWLRELAPNHKASRVTLNCDKAGVADEWEQPIAPIAPPAPVERPGKASSRFDAENVGPGKPPPGGRRVQL